MMRRVLRGAAWGAAAWLIYGAVDLILSAGIQLLRFPEMEILGWQWRLIAMLMGAYAVIGFVLGAVGGIVPGATPQVFASFTITLAFLLNVIPSWPLAQSEYIALAVGLLLLVALPQKRFRFLASPWAVSLLLLTALWMSGDGPGLRHSAAVKTGLSVLLIVAVLAFAVARPRVMNGRPPSLVRQVAMAVLAIGIFAAVVEIAKRPPEIRVSGAPGSPAPKKPNILLITMDTVRADHTSLYGYERDTTPNLRELAKTATLYTRAIATSDFTLPTHASIFTGMYPEWHGAIQASAGPRPLGPSHPILAEILRNDGYLTMQVAANYGYLVSWTGLTRGFIVAETRRPANLAGPDRLDPGRVARKTLKFVVDASGFARTTLTAADITQRGGDLLGLAGERGQPFFLFLNYMDAHAAYLPEPPFDTIFPGSNPQLLPDLSDRRRANLETNPLTEAERLSLVSRYCGAILAEDTSIQQLITRLRRLDLYDNTLIIIMSDHGEAFGEHGLLQHQNGYVYDTFLKVPLIIKYAGQHKGSRSDELTSDIDLMPTIMDAVGLPPIPGLQGRSLLRPGRSDFVYSSAVGPENLATLHRRFRGSRRAIFSGSMKLILWTAGPPELYDLASDPTEQHNLYKPDDPRATELRRRLESWISAMPRLNTPHSLDKLNGERLKSLGYIQ